MNAKISTIDDYSATLDAKGKEVLEQIRVLAAKLLPNCKERISYSMPAFDSDGLIFWFAVWKTHYGLYPKAKALVALAAKVKNYKTSKGCIQFSADEPLPIKLITEIIKYRLKENAEELALKKAKKKIVPKKTAAKKSSPGKKR